MYDEEGRDELHPLERTVITVQTKMSIILWLVALLYPTGVGYVTYEHNKVEKLEEAIIKVAGDSQASYDKVSNLLANLNKYGSDAVHITALKHHDSAGCHFYTIGKPGNFHRPEKEGGK